MVQGSLIQGWTEGHAGLNSCNAPSMYLSHPTGYFFSTTSSNHLTSLTSSASGRCPLSSLNQYGQAPHSVPFSPSFASTTDASIATAGSTLLPSSLSPSTNGLDAYVDYTLGRRSSARGGGGGDTLIQGKGNHLSNGEQD